MVLSAIKTGAVLALAGVLAAINWYLVGSAIGVIGGIAGIFSLISQRKTATTVQQMVLGQRSAVAEHVMHVEEPGPGGTVGPRKGEGGVTRATAPAKAAAKKQASKKSNKTGGGSGASQGD